MLDVLSAKAANELTNFVAFFRLAGFLVALDSIWAWISNSLSTILVGSTGESNRRASFPLRLSLFNRSNDVAQAS